MKGFHSAGYAHEYAWSAVHRRVLIRRMLSDSGSSGSELLTPPFQHCQIYRVSILLRNIVPQVLVLSQRWQKSSSWASLSCIEVSVFCLPERSHPHLLKCTMHSPLYMEGFESFRSLIHFLLCFLVCLEIQELFQRSIWYLNICLLNI